MLPRKIFVGGWFQRTVLHLNEIYQFLLGEDSPLDLDPNKQAQLREALNLKSTELHFKGLDQIKFVTKDDIEVKIYEDGLLVLNTPPTEVEKDIKRLTDFYEGPLSEAIGYLFSLGAPIPKELANIKTIYPYFIVLENAGVKEIMLLLKDFDQEKYFEVKKDMFEIFRGDKLYIINDKGIDDTLIEKLVQEQIFFREFQGQMHRYLNIHRIIWEKIANVKERGEIKGEDINKFKEQVESYAKTINLIEGRINQMGSYISTRKAIIKADEELMAMEGDLNFKYDTLLDTLSYIKNLWAMTKNYVNSANELFTELSSKSTEASVNNLAVITSMGVGATLLGLFVDPQLPELTIAGLVYFLTLAAIGYSVNRLIKFIYSQRKYEISDIKIAKDIK